MSILFLLASLGVINGGLVGLYLLVRKPTTLADRYFGGLLMALSVRIGKSVYHYFYHEADRLILQIGLSACIFIGPLFFLYVKALRQKEAPQSPPWADLALLAALLVAIVSVGIVYPYRQAPEIWNAYIAQGIYWVWAATVVAALYHVAKLFKGVPLNPLKMSGPQQYLAVVVLAMVFITSTYQLAIHTGIGYIWGALIFSFSFYFLMVRALLPRQTVAPANVAAKPAAPLENGETLLLQVNGVMEAQRLYLQPGLKLDDLAAQAAVPRHTLSRVLNEAYPLGFAHYLKTYRVQEAKQLIATRPELSLEGIGYEAGFRSKSAFFEAFKKIAGSTPAQYRKQLQDGAVLATK